ncbi:MAG: PfkB family carbohydrate kinase [Bacteroidota bacterium]
MILTVTLNPLLENRLYFDSVQMGISNRANNQVFRAGGKGINVSRQLNFLGLKNVALTYLGGSNGKILRRIITEENINFSAVSTKSETRAATLAVEPDKEKLTTFFEPNSEITKTEANEFKSKLNKMIQNCSTVVFSGSSPSAETDDIFSYGIQLANELDKMSVLDTYGEHLSSAINASPTIMHNNISEIENSLAIDLSSEKDKICFLNDLYKKGIKLAFLSDGSKATYASKYDFVYKIEQPAVKEIDSTGSGDAFVAGIIYGIEHGFIFDGFVKTGSALGAVNAAKWTVCSSSPEEIDGYIDQVSITPIGKKMKLINDSPTH